ncbi:hypothetical protein BsWGS_04013 [Bradybaena similaris]
MAGEDGKLKFLPRHLQRSQPAAQHKSKRRVTVQDDNGVDEESDRRSVFDRLGPGGSQRNESKKMCLEFQHHGKCHMGKNCIYSHTSKERSKRDGNTSPDNLRLTFKGEKDKENKVRSQVVVRKTDADSDAESGDESDSLSIDNLKQKRQEIQRALIALEAGEEVAVEPKKSDTSEVETSPERIHKKKKDKSKKKEKKKHKKEATEKEQFAEKPKDGKRRHDVDEEEVVPHKKHKKKNKDKKHVEESPPPAIPDALSKQKKNSQAKGQKSTADLYDPASPTSVARPGSPDDRSLSSSPKAKVKSRKKKKKHVKSPGPVVVKSKKLLSPLRKVLKKRGPGSEDSSKESRSVSRSTPQMKCSRSLSSSSNSSSSSSAVRKRKLVPGGGRERARKKSKSLENKKKARSTRRSLSSSSSSSTSTSVSSDGDRGHRRRKRLSQLPTRSGSQTTKGHSPSTTAVRKDMRVWKRKQGTSVESWGRGKEGDSDKKKTAGHSVDRARDKARDRKEAGGHSVDRARDRMEARGHSVDRARDKVRDRKDEKEAHRPQLSHVLKESRQDSREKRRELRDSKADTDVGRPGSGRRQTKELGKDRLDRRDENRQTEVARGGSRDNNLIKEQNKDRRGGSLDRDREERNRRGTAFTAAHAQQGERTARFTRGVGDDDRDRERRNFVEGPARFPPIDGQRLGQFQGDRDRQRPACDRGQGRGGEHQGRGGGHEGRDGRAWDERGRRDGGDTFRDDWQGGRDSRGGGGGAFGYEAGREDRRAAVREDRLLPLLGGWADSGKAPMLERNQRGQGFRDDYGHRENNERRDWKQRENSQESAAQKRPAELDFGRGSREQTGVDGRLKNVPRLTNELSLKVADRDTRAKIAEKSDSSATKVKPETGKEESPMTRDEPSLASLFSQTEIAAVKRKPAKSFGGRKSPKKSGEDNKPGDKAKPGLVARLVTRGQRLPDKKDLVSPAVDTSAADKDTVIDGEKAAGKKSDLKAKSRSLSPKGSQKSADSRYSLSKSSRRSSKSPVAKPAPECQRSPRKTSRSPVPANRDRDRANVEKPKFTERGRKRERERSHSGSASESRHSSHSEDHEEKLRALSSDSESLPAKLDGGDIAAAMLGDSIDDGPQDAFSEWSDDDEAFNILIDGKRKTQVEDLDHLDTRDSDSSRHSLATGGRYLDVREVRTECGLRPVDAGIDKQVLEKNIANVKIVEDIQKEKPAKEKRGRKTDDEGYEEISSDENDLDEEGEKVSKRTIVSILAIDMASLMSTSKPKPTQGPVFERYKAASLFAEMGLSRAYAGDQLYREVQEVCQRRLQETAGPEQTQENTVNIKLDQPSCHSLSDNLSTSSADLKTNVESVPVVSTSSSASLSGGNVSATAIKEDSAADHKPASGSQKKSALRPSADPSRLLRTSLTGPSRPTFTLYGDTSAYHKLNKTRAHERAGLLAQFGMFRRALTARKDLEIRRQLCGIDPKHDQSAVYPSGAVDADTFRQCLQLFKQKKPSVLIAPCGS